MVLFLILVKIEIIMTIIAVGHIIKRLPVFYKSLQIYPFRKDVDNMFLSPLFHKSRLFENRIRKQNP